MSLYCQGCKSLLAELEAEKTAHEKAERERDEALDDKWKLFRIVTDKNVEVMTLERERDEAREALLWTWDKAEAREEDPSGNTLAAVAAARAATKGGWDE